jgi:hypothetical protein
MLFARGHMGVSIVYAKTHNLASLSLSLSRNKSINSQTTHNT